MIADNIWIFDFEVTKADWILVAKSVETGEYFITHNDNHAVWVCYSEKNPLLGGFNNKHYDNHILKAILCNADPETVKYISDCIIVEGMDGWQIPLYRDERVYIDSFDLMDDCQTGTSLKSIEAHLGMDIVESSIPFDIDRPLTEEEVAEMIEYCKHDVDATEILFRLREGYLKNKATLGAAKGYSPRKCLRWTNAGLTAKYLDAEAPEKPRTDERDYIFPSNLKTEYIPTEVMKFFEDIHDKSIPDNEYFSRKLELKIGECKVKIGFGGIHGAIPHYSSREGR